MVASLGRMSPSTIASDDCGFEVVEPSLASSDEMLQSLPDEEPRNLSGGLESDSSNEERDSVTLQQSLNTGDKVADTPTPNLGKSLPRCKKPAGDAERGAADSRENQSGQVDQNDERRSGASTQHSATVARKRFAFDLGQFFHKDNESLLTAIMARLDPLEKILFDFLRWYDSVIPHLQHNNLSREVLIQKMTMTIFPHESVEISREYTDSSVTLHRACEHLAFCREWVMSNGRPESECLVALGVAYGMVEGYFRSWWERYRIDGLPDTLSNNMSARGWDTEPEDRIPDQAMTHMKTVVQQLRQDISQLQDGMETKRKEKESERQLVQSLYKQIEQMEFDHEDLREEISDLEVTLEDRDEEIHDLSEENERLEFDLTGVQELLAEKDSCLKKALEVKTQLSNEHSENVKGREQFDAELLLEREKSKKLQNEIDRLLPIIQEDIIQVRQHLGLDISHFSQREREQSAENAKARENVDAELLLEREKSKKLQNEVDRLLPILQEDIVQVRQQLGQDIPRFEQREREQSEQLQKQADELRLQEKEHAEMCDALKEQVSRLQRSLVNSGVELDTLREENARLHATLDHKTEQFVNSQEKSRHIRKELKEQVSNLQSTLEDREAQLEVLRHEEASLYELLDRKNQELAICHKMMKNRGRMPKADPENVTTTLEEDDSLDIQEVRRDGLPAFLAAALVDEKPLQRRVSFTFPKTL
ncbi:hypothetical protein DFS34DRAFT_166055 [Phlyctochytrium arcticum]|nr:hypothetical protein DFS34DRAFT_166055 [Phlyctochytrium arcticum]